MRNKGFLSVTLVILVVLWARCLHAQGGTDSGLVPEAASGPSSTYVKPFGVPLAPPIYLVNFLLLYFSNPETATNMPAYRVALPQEIYKCLVENPDGCRYPAMAQFSPSRPSTVEAAKTRTLSGQVRARRTPDGKA
jgi:hypothetical protein